MAITGSPPATNTWTVPPPSGRELHEDELGVYYWSSPPKSGYKIRNPSTLPGTTIGAIERSRTPAREAPASTQVAGIRRNLGEDKQMATELTIEEIEESLRNNFIDQDQARELIRAALIKSGFSEDRIDQEGSLILNSMLQRITTGADVGGGGGGAAADGTLWRDPIISEPSFGQAFSRFMGGTPFAATPGLMSAAAAMRPIAQTQFQLQPSTPVWDPETGELQPRDIGEFSRFLPGAFGGGAGGSFLRGGDLSQRLSELTRALFRERGQGDDPINPYVDTRQAQLFQEFGDPQNTFSAFNLPGLMATQGRGRALLGAAQNRFRNRWLGQNPNATGWDVANQAFGRSANWT